jgi:putative alpha-1,2-mannosidase
MVKLGPDLYTGSDSYSGYQPTGNFTGFSMLHESGTGGAPKYGVVSQMPVVGNVCNPLADHSDTRLAPDVSEVGYYKSSLGSGVLVELAAAERAGLYQYTFPNSGPRNIIVDVSHVLSSYRGMGLEQHYLGGSITVGKDGNQTRYHGYGSYDNVGTCLTKYPRQH